MPHTPNGGYFRSRVTAVSCHSFDLTQQDAGAQITAWAFGAPASDAGGAAESKDGSDSESDSDSDSDDLEAQRERNIRAHNAYFKSLGIAADCQVSVPAACCLSCIALLSLAASFSSAQSWRLVVAGAARHGAQEAEEAPAPQVSGATAAASARVALLGSSTHAVAVHGLELPSAVCSLSLWPCRRASRKRPPPRRSYPSRKRAAVRRFVPARTQRAQSVRADRVACLPHMACDSWLVLPVFSLCLWLMFLLSCMCCR